MPRKERLSYNQYMREYRQRNNESMRAYDRTRRMRRKTESKCIRCGSPLREEEIVYCVACICGRNLPVEV
jgi:hypothetical protein